MVSHDHFQVGVIRKVVFTEPTKVVTEAVRVTAEVGHCTMQFAMLIGQTIPRVDSLTEM
jgi:hypothetical protein